ncbi:TetR family transcriptional regulator [Lacisediminihabitans sp.]|uniref:TetR family transcriptional regulator n=1 Tax=Lacisediminihabitans sp. TaxID=2787631 RepID=UPI00374D98FF
MNIKTERGRQTRETLIAAARALFAERGYDATSIEAVLEQTDVSRGALYHHFGGKEELFAAVLDGIYDTIDERVAVAAANQPNASAALQAGCLEWIRMASDRAVGRVLLIDAPAVLGWTRWRAMDEARTLLSIRTALESAARHGSLAEDHVDFFAHALLASMNEIALMIAQSAEPAVTSARAEGAVAELFRRILLLPSS